MNTCLNCGKFVKNKYCNVSCQNKHLNTFRSNSKYGIFKTFIISCHKCNNSFDVIEREKLYPQKKNYFCSASCANSRIHSEETKNKIESTLIKRNAGNREIDKNKTCKECNKLFNSRIKTAKFCSVSCSTIWKNTNLGISRLGGLASVSSQSKSRRSKNEIYFGQLCEQKFKSVKFNEPMFNGWDADVIIEDLKLAVLWNGKWHYEKIKDKHSVNQVQNRDKIKQKEIIGKGYKPYIIKDMGKYDKKFVENKFKEFLVYLKL